MFSFGCKKSDDKTTDPTPTNTVTDVDGNVYHYVTIGTQVWMVENLKTIHYRNGNPIPNVTDNNIWQNLTTDAYCTYDNANNAPTYGNLYNWYAVNDSRKIAPSGWHVPTDAEWSTLSNYLGGSMTAGGKLKEAGTTHWNTPNTGATNDYGFTALPGGNHVYSFGGIGNYGEYWSSTTNDAYTAFAYQMNWSDKELHRDTNGHDYMAGFSVRCIKD